MHTRVLYAHGIWPQHTSADLQPPFSYIYDWPTAGLQPPFSHTQPTAARQPPFSYTLTSALPWSSIIPLLLWYLYGTTQVTPDCDTWLALIKHTASVPPGGGASTARCDVGAIWIGRYLGAALRQFFSDCCIRPEHGRRRSRSTPSSTALWRAEQLWSQGHLGCKLPRWMCVGRGMLSSGYGNRTVVVPHNSPL